MRTLFILFTLFIFTLTSAQNDTTFSSEIADEITKFIESKKDFYNCPNISVAITNESETIYLKHFGETKKSDKYLIGSNTKSFTALLTLILEKEGLLNINEPVKKYLSWFRYKNKNISDKITLKDLLQHTSGINTSIGQTFKENDTNFDYIEYYKNVLQKIDVTNIDKQPYIYSNANYRLLGFIIEKVTGKSYEECITKFITKPMKLNETSASLTPDLIDSYQYFLYNPIISYNPNFHRQEIPSGLISSTANDMSIYLRNLMNSYNRNSNTIISNTTSKQLFTANKSNKSNYGLGWRIVNGIFYHSGTNESFEASMYILPSIKKAIVVLVNSNQAPDGEIIDGIASILMKQKVFGSSSFPYYRNLPFAVMIFLLVFL